ncbi:MAG TPA: AsmA family protein [Candidatus Omnitrophota bacterium]|nr:AsmA family protein [Candidatus Omnitrophota bacterium]HPS20130.1 AsmA family protein [Candidatus Omnitrophota bacterium]
MIKRINFPGIALLLTALIAIQYGVGLFAAQYCSALVLKQISDHTDAKVTLEKAHIWPLTMTIDLEGLKVFDPDDTSKRIASIGKMRLRVSLLGVLSKKLIFSDIKISGADINFEREPDGSYNIQKISRQSSAGKSDKGVLSSLKQVYDTLRPKQDLFSSVYDALKKKSSVKKTENSAQTEKAKTTERVVTAMPKGKRVVFMPLGGENIIDARAIAIENARVRVGMDKDGSLDVNEAGISIKNLVVSAESGVSLSSASLKGKIEKDDKTAGRCDIYYNTDLRGQRVVLNVRANDLDLAALAFIYNKSLPVDISRGVLNIDSKTMVDKDALSSKNKLSLKDARIAAKGGISGMASGILPLPVMCELLNKINPIELDFEVGGTLDKPDMRGFQKSLFDMVKPYMSSAEADLKKEGANFLQNMINKVKKSTSGANPEATSGSSQNTGTVDDAIKSIQGLVEKTETKEQ